MLLPKHYETWVVKPGLVAEDDETCDFLQTSDLDPTTKDAPDLSRTRGIPGGKNGPQPVTSLLNSQLLDRIACAALDIKHVADSPRPYISETLHIYMAVEPARRALFSSFRQECREQPPTRSWPDRKLLSHDLSWRPRALRRQRIGQVEQ
jgi:hypothetical protein